MSNTVDTARCVLQEGLVEEFHMRFNFWHSMSRSVDDDNFHHHHFTYIKR